MRVLVCGGRDFNDYPLGMRTLDTIHAETPITLIIHGGARGADTMAQDWALSKGACSGIRTREFTADWEQHGLSAGPIRNQQMLADGKPELVVAFQGGTGTADMVKRARKAGVRVIEVVGTAVAT